VQTKMRLFLKKFKENMKKFVIVSFICLNIQFMLNKKSLSTYHSVPLTRKCSCKEGTLETILQIVHVS